MIVVAPFKVSWEKLPDDFVLDNEPVDNLDQPALAAALTESLELAGKLPATALTTTNYGICATVDQRLVVKAPDWGYVPSIRVPRQEIRRSYTPRLQGGNLVVVMEFLSDAEGGEYSSKPTYPLGKWFFYEQVLQVPNYVIFEPGSGALEVYRLDDLGCYQLRQPDEREHYWIAEMNLFLGTWQGTRENRSGYWLRWWDQHGNLLLWGSELAERERREKDSALQRAEQAEQARREAVSRLLGMGLSAEQVAEALGLPVEHIDMG